MIFGDDCFSILVHIDYWERESDDGNPPLPPPPLLPTGESAKRDDRNEGVQNGALEGHQIRGGDEELGEANSDKEPRRTKISANYPRQMRFSEGL